MTSFNLPLNLQILIEIINHGKKKKYPKIEPQLFKDKSGKTKAVYLFYDVYELILEEMQDLEQRTKNIKRAGAKK